MTSRRPRPFRRRCAVVLIVSVVLGFLSACAEGSSSSGTASGSASADGVGHVHAVAVNPGDGKTYVATHSGLLRVESGRLVRVGETRHDLMGFTVVGPNEFLASGHPDPTDTTAPPLLGLLRTVDGGVSWSSVSLSGAADLHAITTSGPVVYAWDSSTGAVLRSEDGGAGWRTGARGDLTDLAVDPTDPQRVWAATPNGVAESTDGGAGFRLLPPAGVLERPMLFLDRVPDLHGDREPDPVGVDVAGVVWGRYGEGWRRTGELGAAPVAFAVSGPDRYLAATATQVLASENAGASWTRLAALSP